MSHQAFLDFRHVTYLARVDGWRSCRAAMREMSCSAGLLSHGCPWAAVDRCAATRAALHEQTSVSTNPHHGTGGQGRDGATTAVTNCSTLAGSRDLSVLRAAVRYSAFRQYVATGRLVRSPCARSAVATPSSDVIAVYVVCAYAMMRVAHRIVCGTSLRCAAGVSAGSTSPTLTGLHHALRR